VCRIRDRGQTFRITFDYQTGGLPFCDGANVSVGQFNQSSIEILFALCHGPGRHGAKPFKALGCSDSRFLPRTLHTNLQDSHNVFNESLRENADS